MRSSRLFLALPFLGSALAQDRVAEESEPSIPVSKGFILEYAQVCRDLA